LPYIHNAEMSGPTARTPAMTGEPDLHRDHAAETKGRDRLGGGLVRTAADPRATATVAPATIAPTLTPKARPGIFAVVIGHPLRRHLVSMMRGRSITRNDYAVESMKRNALTSPDVLEIVESRTT